jgi:hypothetical protein
MFIAYFQSQWLENAQIAIREWNVSTLESYRTNNHHEGNNNRLNYRITPSIAGNLWTFLKSLMKEQISQSRALFQFQHLKGPNGLGPNGIGGGPKWAGPNRAVTNHHHDVQ